MEDQFLLFEDYILGNLTPKEQEDFEQRLQNNTVFSTQFSNYKETHSYLRYTLENIQEQNDFKQNLEKISEVHFKQYQTRKNNFWYLGVAASIALLVGVFFFNQKEPTYADFISYPNISFTERGTANNLLKNAEIAFNNKDFLKATSLFSQLLENNPDNTEFKLYQGFSLVELNRFKESDAILSELSNGNSSYKTKAIWYLALSKLKQKDITTCRALLKKIPKDAILHKKATELLDKLSD